VGRRERLPHIRSGIGQSELSKPDVVDHIKDDLLSGRFEYETDESR